MKYFVFPGGLFGFMTIVNAIISFEMTMSMCEDHCKRQQFRMIPGRNISGEVLEYDGPWPWKTCRRLCRQYLECLAFKVPNTFIASMAKCRLQQVITSTLPK